MTIEKLLPCMNQYRAMRVTYPNTKSAKVRRGKVKECRNNNFDFDEDKDGLVTYSYKYLVEVKNED